MKEPIIVHWPPGDGGRPADVFKEIKELLETRCHLTCDGLACVPKGDDGYIVIYDFDKDDGWHPCLEGSSPIIGFLWDWKEPRASMIADLNTAMRFFYRQIEWGWTK